MTPVEQAALLSATWDGHEGRVGINPTMIGAKTADPSLKVSMGGLSGATQVALDNVAVMRLWFQANRKDKKFAADILNFHFYCNDDQTSKGASPEECKFERVMRALTTWRDANEPSLQVWLTEFGYDTSSYSPNLAPAYAHFDAQDVQGMWLIRSYMYMSIARIDRAHMFMLADSHDDGGQKFQTSGLTTAQTSNYNPKKSWYHVSTMSKLLRHTRFAGEVSPVSGGSDARIANFTRDAGSAKGPATVLVAWLGSKTGASSSTTIDVGAAATRAVLVALSGNSTNGIQSALAISGGKITLTVTEMPSFIILGEGATPQPSTGPVPPVDPPVAPACADLPRGLHCTGTGTYNGSYIICPGGEAGSCTGGDTCVQTSAGVVDCGPNPASLCASKPHGLFCDPAAKKPGWPDGYVECPKLEVMYCPMATSVCVQKGETVECHAKSDATGADSDEGNFKGAASSPLKRLKTDDAPGGGEADVIVYGSTPGAIISAVAAARHGAKTFLLDPAPRVGGMCSGGLGRTDRGNSIVIGGFAQEFFERNRAHYYPAQKPFARGKPGTVCTNSAHDIS